MFVYIDFNKSKLITISYWSEKRGKWLNGNRNCTPFQHWTRIKRTSLSILEYEIIYSSLRSLFVCVSECVTIQGRPIFQITLEEWKGKKRQHHHTHISWFRDHTVWNGELTPHRTLLNIVRCTTYHMENYWFVFLISPKRPVLRIPAITNYADIAVNLWIVVGEIL